MAAGEFLEWAEFDDNLYGTPLAPVVARLTFGESVLRLVFLRPPSWDELVRRLTERRTEPPEVVERRLAVAKDELAAEAEFDHVVVNSDVKQVCEELVTLLGYRP